MSSRIELHGSPIPRHVGPGGLEVLEAPSLGTDLVVYHGWTGDVVGYGDGGVRSLYARPIRWVDGKPVLVERNAARPRADTVVLMSSPNVNSNMEYRRLGASGLRVSVLSFGSPGHLR